LTNFRTFGKLLIIVEQKFLEVSSPLFNYSKEHKDYVKYVSDVTYLFYFTVQTVFEIFIYPNRLVL